MSDSPKTTYTYEERAKIDADAKLLAAKAEADRAEAAKEAAKATVLKELAAIPPEIRDGIEGYQLPSEQPKNNGLLQLDHEQRVEWDRRFFDCVGGIFGKATAIHLIWAFTVCFVVYTYCVRLVAR